MRAHGLSTASRLSHMNPRATTHIPPARVVLCVLLFDIDYVTCTVLYALPGPGTLLVQFPASVDERSSRFVRFMHRPV